MCVTSSIHCRCGHCEKFAPVWEELETYYNSDITVDIGKVRERGGERERAKERFGLSKRERRVRQNFA